MHKYGSRVSDMVHGPLALKSMGYFWQEIIIIVLKASMSYLWSIECLNFVTESVSQLKYDPYEIPVHSIQTRSEIIYHKFILEYLSQ